MNTKLLRKVQRAILREPKRYNQDTWCDGNSISPDGSCGTVGCIAGWACAIEVGLEEYAQKYTGFDAPSIEMNARKFLDIDYIRGESPRLFLTENWPKIFHPWIGEYGRLKGRPWTKALLAVLRIEIFIRSEGRI